jgi:uncharacterized protein (DUF2249 family)
MRVKARQVHRRYVASMTQTCSEQVVDVRPMSPRQRHPAIFTAWQQLSNGQALTLVNDHDPLPLYFQFACEFAGCFNWEYLEQGPATWRVRILKGEHLDPGFMPVRQTKPITTTAADEPLVLDTRPIFHRGESPCAAIDAAVAELSAGQPLVLLVPFEPVPLYMKLNAQGFTHTPSQDEDGTWRIEFRRAPAR